MSMPIPEDKLTVIKEALFSGRKIEAIKLYREATDAGLAEAKTAVEKIEAELRASSPEKFTAPTAKKGCFGVRVAMLVVAVAAIRWVAR
jgi:ribosomal protein L7/L12